MKKVKAILRVACLTVLALSLVVLPACGGGEEASGENASEITFDGSSYSDTGAGTFFLEGTDGTRSNSGDVVLVISRNASSSSIYFEAEGYAENPKTYFFLDGVLVAQNNIPGKTIGLLTVPQASLTEGAHRAEAVQFTGDAVGGEVVSYKSVEFTIKYEDAPTEAPVTEDPAVEGEEATAETDPAAEEGDPQATEEDLEATEEE